LSTQRAESVKVALVARGIVSTRIKAEGFGAGQPIVVNAISESDHQRNRRAALLIKNEKVENIRTTSFDEGISSLIKTLGLK